MTDTDLQFVPIETIAKTEVIDLMNNPKVAAQMPLLAGGFSEEMYQAFITSKQELWLEHGYGPWAFIINGKFAGWGGLQYEQGSADFALVLHPKFWGWGKVIFKLIIQQAKEAFQLDVITILFPPSRKNWRAITRIGFEQTDKIVINDHSFTRFKLALNTQT